MKKNIKAILVSIILSIFILIIIVNITPNITALLIRRVMDISIPTEPINYKDYVDKVTNIKDLYYKSEHKNNTYDVYMPQDIQKNYPTIIWVHGGAFVGGDKKCAEIFATMLASCGYVVLSMNYELAPEAKYPTPIKQVEEFYNHIINEKSKYLINENRIFFAGDSAGAQIVSQFVAIQTNKDLAEKMNMNKIVPKNSIKGLLLYCGPYDFKLLCDLEYNYLLKFLLDQLAWSYIGKKNYKNSEEVKECSVVDYITEEFPPSFITDGNTNSFENHNRRLIEVLKEKNIEIEELFFLEDQCITDHEYQFKQDTESGKKVFNSTIDFLERHSTD